MPYLAQSTKRSVRACVGGGRPAVLRKLALSGLVSAATCFSSRYRGEREKRDTHVGGGGAQPAPAVVGKPAFIKPQKAFRACGLDEAVQRPL